MSNSLFNKEKRDSIYYIFDNVYYKIYCYNLYNINIQNTLYKI